MDPFDQQVNHSVASHNFDPVQKSGDKHPEDFNDYFSQKPGKINDTINFLNAETGRAQEVVADIAKAASKTVENIIDNAGDFTSKYDNVPADTKDFFSTEQDKVSTNAQDVYNEKLDDSDLLGLSESVLIHDKTILEPLKPELSPAPISDNVRDLLFDEKEQDELKGFDQYTSDSNASLKVNLSCENDDTASTKSIDSAQSIPTDEKKNLLKENLIEDVPEVSKFNFEDNLLEHPTPKVAEVEKEVVATPELVVPISEPIKVQEVKKEEIIAKPDCVLPKPETPKVQEEKKEAVAKPDPPKPKTPLVKKAPSTEMFIGPHEVFSQFGLDTWFNPEKLNPKVESLVYWRDPKLSGAVFGVSLAVLISLAYFSLISVAANLALLVLLGAIGFRIYKSIFQAIQKTNDGHPFKEYLELDVSLPADKVRAFTEASITHVDSAVRELRRIFLVEDFVDSIKFVIILWTFTYVGSWFNGLTLVIIGFVALFTLPKVYENNKATIDANLEIVQGKIADITSKVKAAIPIGKKEEKKEQ